MYVHLTDETHIKPFESTFLSITFQDAKATHKDQSLRNLPPTLGFAPVQRVPAVKPRMDGRQGTIDQDPEYMAFLEGETQPVQKPPALDTATADKPKEAVTTTPLIEALREKKANKEKAKAAKSVKREDVKEEKPVDKAAAKKGGKTATIERKAPVKPDSAPKETVPAANRQSKKIVPVATSAPTAPTAAAPAQAAPAPAKRRERAQANIKTMLQRDLGLAQAPRRNVKQETPAENPTATQAPSTAATAVLATAETPARNARFPRKGRELAVADNAASKAISSQPNASSTTNGVLKNNDPALSQPRNARSKPTNAPVIQPQPTSTPSAQPRSSNPAGNTAKASKPAPQPSPGATKAYLKHANASQGITEPLILAALSSIGEVLSVEIDKRKGTAIAEFKSHESLKAAMAKRSVNVAEGAVEVLEYREKSSPQASRGGPAAAGRGGSMRGRGRGAAGRGGSSAVATASSAATPAATPAPPSTNVPTPAGNTTAIPATGDGT